MRVDKPDLYKAAARMKTPRMKKTALGAKEGESILQVR